MKAQRLNPNDPEPSVQALYTFQQLEELTKDECQWVLRQFGNSNKTIDICLATKIAQALAGLIFVCTHDCGSHRYATAIFVLAKILTEMMNDSTN